MWDHPAAPCSGPCAPRCLCSRHANQQARRAAAPLPRRPRRPAAGPRALQPRRARTPGCVRPRIPRPKETTAPTHPQAVGEDRGGDHLVLGHLGQQLVVGGLRSRLRGPGWPGRRGQGQGCRLGPSAQPAAAAPGGGLPARLRTRRSGARRRPRRAAPPAAPSFPRTWSKSTRLFTFSFTLPLLHFCAWTGGAADRRGGLAQRRPTRAAGPAETANTLEPPRQSASSPQQARGCPAPRPPPPSSCPCCCWPRRAPWPPWTSERAAWWRRSERGRGRGPGARLRGARPPSGQLPALGEQVFRCREP